MGNKGSAAERELISMFWGSGWAAMRAAGSGSSRFPCPDLLASNGSQILAIECKAGKNASKYIDAEQVKQLKEFAEKFHAKPIVATKVSNKGWFFFELDDLDKTKEGNFVANDEAILKKAKYFFDIIKNEKQERLDGN